MTPMLLAPVPMLIVLLLAMAAVIPWGGPDWVELALALMPVSAVYFWSVRRPRLVPAVAIFALGLLLDVTTQGPLGVWTVAVLIAGLAGRLARQAQVRQGWVRATLSTVAALAAATLAVAAITSLYGMQLVAWRPVLEAFGVACLVYPVLASALAAVDGLWPAPAERMLFLRGD